MLVFYFISIFYLETLFNFTTLNQYNIIYLPLFTLIYSLIIFILSKLSNEKINRIISYIFITILTLLFISQLIYFKTFNNIISIASFYNGTTQVMEFKEQVFQMIYQNKIEVLLLTIPLLVFIIVDTKKIINYQKILLKKYVCAVLILISFILILININDEELYSPKNLYYNTHMPSKTASTFGVLTTIKLDIYRHITDFQEKEITPITTQFNFEEKETEYNMFDIDYLALANTEDPNINYIYTYIASQQPSEKNEYTSFFEGKNLILIVAEAFSHQAINEQLTPTLYKLYNEGFQFNNFYTPLYPVSTADGQYMHDTGLLPVEGIWSLKNSANNYLPYSYANTFKNLGYSTNAYHNHTANYYGRVDYFQNSGFDSYKACGLNLNINCNIWPESDLEMLEATTIDYINDDNFFAYYMTVSGHLEYNQYGNAMVYKNYDAVIDLDLSESAKSYLATHIELDKAIEHLITELEKYNKLDDTVISIVSDHYPYGLTIDELNELSDYQIDETFEIHKTPWILWNNQMEETVKVDTYSQAIDVMPTLYNLFGINYESRLFAGTDIFSKQNELVIFSNRNFITEKGKYNLTTDTFTGQYDKEYINEINEIIYNKFKFSKLIFETDFYEQLKEDLN